MKEQNFELVRFHPWKGQEYSNGLWGQKLLIVGESHYNEWTNNTHELTKDITQNCIREIVEGEGGAPYWSHVLNRVGGKEYENNPTAFWSRVAFYNFIQSPVSGTAGRNVPTKQQWDYGKKAIFEVLDFLKPQKIIFTGIRIGKNLPCYINLGSIVADELDPVREMTVGSFEKRQEVFLICPHPRSGRLIKELTPYFKKFVSDNHEMTAERFC